MYGNPGVQRYRETDIASMSREKMIVLLYERIVTDLKSAQRAVEQGNRIEMTKQVNHSQRIISELRSALDHTIGGEIAANLDALYSYLFHEHLELLLDRSPVHIENCLSVIHPLLEAWRQIPTGTGEKAAQETTGNRQPVAGGPETASGPLSNRPETRDRAEALADSGNRPPSLLSVSA